MAELELVWAPELGGWAPLHHLNGEGGKPGLYLAGDAAGVDNVEVCEFEGAMVATVLAGKAGMIDPARGAEMRAELAASMRPARMAAYDSDPTYAQPWLVPWRCKDDQLHLPLRRPEPERVDEVIAEGKTTLNDVKRHTRVGMGRCQGVMPLRGAALARRSWSRSDDAASSGAPDQTRYAC
ncbi:MAG: hypothetical protein R2848_04230 [Thermomicrobiales bacterium]